MRVLWQGLTLALHSPDERVRAAWARLFDYELAQAPLTDAAAGDGPATVHIAALAAAPPAAPPGPPLLDEPAQQVRIYGAGEGFRMFLGEGYYAAVLPRLRQISIMVPPQGVEEGYFEDLLGMALAPVLRRHGLYMTHAFSAAAAPDKALLLVGESGSGKTTTGLALCAAGLQLLANDIAALRRTSRGVEALLSPGSVQVTAATLRLLPALRPHLLQGAPYKAPLSRAGLLGQGALLQSAPVTAVFFPQLDDPPRPAAAVPVSRAVGLARLMSAGMDRWDTAALPGHLALLTALSKQARFYTLHLNPDLAQVAAVVKARV